jgi:hypothetical protein
MEYSILKEVLKEYECGWSEPMLRAKNFAGPLDPATSFDQLIVTTPPEIIPYYRPNHSIWSLNDNKESSR